MDMIYYLLRNAQFILRDIGKNVPRALLASFGIIFFISFLFIFISLRTSVREFIVTRIFNTLDLNEIKVTPRNMVKFVSLNMFSTSRNHIPEGKIRVIRNLPGIRSLQRVIRLNAPAQVSFGILGNSIGIDVVIYGVEKSFFRGTKIDWKNFSFGRKLPIVIPYMAMELINHFAVANGLPEIGEKGVQALTPDVTLGRSTFAGTRESARQIPASVAGFTSRLNIAGIVVPSQFIRDYCTYTGADSSCIMLMLKASTVSGLPGLVSKIKGMGLQVESQSDVVKKTNRIVGFIDGTFLFLLVIILSLTVIAIVNAYTTIISRRSYEISLKRMLGASKVRILLIFVLEAAMIGLLHGTLGYVLGLYAVRNFSDLLVGAVPVLKGFAVRPAEGLLAASVAVSAGVSVLSVLIPAVIASNQSMFRNTKRY